MPHLKFAKEASSPRDGIAVIFDLEGFSRFFNQPDVQVYVSAFLNRVFSVMDRVFEGGAMPWTKKGKELNALTTQLAHVKFMGDGALYILMPPAEQSEIASNEILYLCNRLWLLKRHFPDVLKECAEDVPVLDLPQRIRFGVAKGTIYELTDSSSGEKEFIGFPLNLASRLQRYCPDLGFIASARLRLSDASLKKCAYIKVVATQLRGFPKEIVIVDKSEYEGLSDATRDALFAPL